MKRAFLLIATIALLFACEGPKTDTISQGEHIVGLAGPIVLTPESPTIHRADYFPDTSMLRVGISLSPIANYESIERNEYNVYQLDSEVSYTEWSQVCEADTYYIPVFFSPVEPINFEYRGEADSVFLFGTFNAWNRTVERMQKEDDSFTSTLELAPNSYQYKFFVWNDGKAVEVADARADSVSNGMGGYNSTLVVDFPGAAPVALDPIAIDERTVELTKIPEDQIVLAYWQNQRLRIDTLGNGHYSIRVPQIDPKCSYAEGRSYVRIFSTRNAQRSNDVLIPLESGKIVNTSDQLARSDWQTAVMYFMMVDRFKNGSAANDSIVPDPDINPKANYHGGDITGITEVLQSGFFEELGTNTIWLSPIVQNPWDAWGLWNKGGVTSKFSGYHGYWPISNIRPDVRFGSPEEVHQLLDEAHDDDFNVLIDYVANHVHEQHPVYVDHPDWATPLYLPDGTLNTEKWDEQRLTTWFDTFMPTLELRNPEVVDYMTDSALVWVTEYDFDGFRHDATKHIDELYWRTLTLKIKALELDRRIYQIGETYGSPELINSYIGNGMLDAQFDFNVYDAAVSAFVSSAPKDVENLVNTLNQSWNTYGYHNLMGYISGNQDRSRFISLASGDVLLGEDQKLAGWTREIPKPNEQAYHRLGLLHAFNFAIPGIPVIYYGDEYGMWGANDPDNRKMMKFTGYDSDEAALRADVQALTKARASEIALLYGNSEVEIVEQNVIHITRTYLGERVQIWINPGPYPVLCEVSIENILAGHLVEGDEGNVLEPLSFVYVKE